MSLVEIASGLRYKGLVNAVWDPFDNETLKIIKIQIPVAFVTFKKLIIHKFNLLKLIVLFIFRFVLYSY